eukprot:COSAG04_NODE_741_length_10670_cov_20.643837_2_plen_230_part_00
MANRNEGCQLLLNDGAWQSGGGNFLESAAPPAAIDPRYTDVAAGDVDGDGWTDIMLASVSCAGHASCVGRGSFATSELSLLRNAGGESWGGFDTVVAGIAADQSIVRSDALSDWSKFSVGLGHFNSDQHLDAFVGSDLGSNRVLFGDGGGGFAELACSGSLCNDKRDDANHFFLQGDGSRMHSDVFTKAAVVCDINSDGLVSQSAVCGQSAVCKQDHACASIAHECLAA